VVLIYNIADTYFVGQTGDPFQVAAVSLAMPVFLLFMATGNLLGIGGTSVISRSLGAGDKDHARKVSSFVFYSSILLGVLFTLTFWILMPFILKAIGTSEQTIGFARDYLAIVAPSAPFVIISIAFSNIVRAEGKAKEAMMGTMLGTIVNIILDPIMILTLDMGVAGAALATLIGNMAGSIYYLNYILRGKTILSIAPRDFRIKDKVFTGVMAIGIPAALNNVLMSLSSILLNNYLAAYGDIEVAAMGVAMKVVLIVALLQIGLGAGIQPLLGYSFGAGDHKRFNAIMRTSIIYTVILGSVLTLGCWVGASGIVGAFIDSGEVYSHGISFTRYLLLTGPVIGILFVYINSLQAIGAARESLIISISRQGFVFVPMIIILNSLFGLTGVIMAQPVADMFSLIMSAIIYTYKNRKMWNGIEEPVMVKQVS
ncbi:MAG: MATE family efflux transporter, partial [Spirochaetales bacterium]|nr:MATE family efflux transporter [Spirochaetales bacterium]